MVTTLLDNHLKQIKPQEEKKKLQVLASECNGTCYKAQTTIEGEWGKKGKKKANHEQKSCHVMVCHDTT